jgi:type II secretory pathway pseudopilin PulG
MKTSGNTAGKSHAGMTLMEVVIAIGVVAFVVPLILAATGSAGKSRRNAEADTRSAWIAREVRQELILSWGEHPSKSVFEESMDFPTLASIDDPEILLYDSDGKFLEKGGATDFTGSSQVTDAVYVIAIYAEEYIPPNLSATANPLAILHVQVLHPAKADPAARSSFRYNVITTKQGTL